jgi:hypothetical protein
VLDELWTTLHARRDDPTFWTRFRGLVAGLRAAAAGEGAGDLAHPAAELFDRAQVDRLVGELQAALRAAPGRPARDALRRALPGLGAPVATLLLLLGCGGNGKAGAGPPEAEPIAPAEPPAATVEEYTSMAPLGPERQEALRSCFLGVPPGRKAELVTLFRDRPPEEIARTLEAMLAPGGECWAAPDADAGAWVDAVPETGAAPEVQARLVDPADGDGSPDVADGPADAAAGDAGKSRSAVDASGGRRRNVQTRRRPARGSSSIYGHALYKGVTFS